MSKKSPPTPKVAVGLPHTAAALLVFAKVVENGLANNKALFPAPNPPLAQFSTDVAALDAAELATHTRASGTVAVRDSKLLIVKADLRKIGAYVQGLVDADTANAASIAQALGFRLKTSTTRSKSELSAKPNAKASGAVDLAAKVGGVKSSHEWQYSSDGGKSWIAAQTTLQGKTTVTGLQPGSTVSFRHRAVTKTGPDAWSQAVTIIVT